jgi:hypothetical protein
MAALVLPPGSVYALADMKTHDVQYPGHGGDSVPAYVARLAEAGAFPGIIIVHGVHGLEEHIKDVARRFTVHGYVAIAPALFPVRNSLPVWRRRMSKNRSYGHVAGPMPRR